MEDIQRMNVFHEIRPQATQKEVEQVVNTHIHVDDMKILLRYMNMDKLGKYLEKQDKAEKPVGYWNSVARLYRDYIEECQTLGLDLNDKQVLFPKNLKQAHERTMAQIKFEKNKADQEKFQKSLCKTLVREILSKRKRKMSELRRISTLCVRNQRKFFS